MPWLTVVWGLVTKYVLPYVWHAIQRFWSVFLVAAVITIILMKWGAFKNTLYDKGYHAGYNQAIKDHPSQTAGTITNNSYNAEDFKYIGVRARCLFIKFSVGR